MPKKEDGDWYCLTLRVRAKKDTEAEHVAEAVIDILDAGVHGHSFLLYATMPVATREGEGASS